MALVQRLASILPATISSVVRPAASVRVASFHGEAVEEAAISSETFFDSLPYEYTGNQPLAQNDDQHRPQIYQHRREHFGVLNSTTETFASLLAKEIKDDQIDELGNVYQNIYPSEVSRAIGIYELNNEIIHGLNPVLGTKISITL